MAQRSVDLPRALALVAPLRNHAVSAWSQRWPLSTNRPGSRISIDNESAWPMPAYWWMSLPGLMDREHGAKKRPRPGSIRAPTAGPHARTACEDFPGWCLLPEAIAGCRASAIRSAVALPRRQVLALRKSWDCGSRICRPGIRWRSSPACVGTGSPLSTGSTTLESCALATRQLLHGHGVSSSELLVQSTGTTATSKALHSSFAIREWRTTASDVGPLLLQPPARPAPAGSGGAAAPGS